MNCTVNAQSIYNNNLRGFTFGNHDLIMRHAGVGDSGIILAIWGSLMFAQYTVHRCFFSFHLHRKNIFWQQKHQIRMWINFLDARFFGPAQYLRHHRIPLAPMYKHSYFNFICWKLFHTSIALWYHKRGDHEERCHCVDWHKTATLVAASSMKRHWFRLAA